MSRFDRMKQDGIQAYEEQRETRTRIESLEQMLRRCVNTGLLPLDLQREAQELLGGKGYGKFGENQFGEGARPTLGEIVTE